MKRHHLLRVDDLMSRPAASVLATDTVGFAELAMKLLESRHVPVVDTTGRLVGVLSARDVLRGGAIHRESVTVGSLMTRRVITVGPREPASLAATMLIENVIGCLPVVADDGHLVGIVTETDFLLVAKEACDGVRPERRARP